MPTTWREALYARYLERVGGDTTLPPEPPELRAGLVYRDDGWHVRRAGPVTRHAITCYRGHRLHVPDTVRDTIRHCQKPDCDASVFVVSFRPPLLWAVDLAPHEVALAMALSACELVEWLDLSFPTSSTSRSTSSTNLWRAP